MRKLIIILSVLILCASCGVKSDPEYQAQFKSNKKIKII